MHPSLVTVCEPRTLAIRGSPERGAAPSDRSHRTASTGSALTPPLAEGERRTGASALGALYRVPGRLDRPMPPETRPRGGAAGFVTRSGEGMAAWHGCALRRKHLNRCLSDDRGAGHPLPLQSRLESSPMQKIGRSFKRMVIKNINYVYSQIVQWFAHEGVLGPETGCGAESR